VAVVEGFVLKPAAIWERQTPPTQRSRDHLEDHRSRRGGPTGCSIRSRAGDSYYPRAGELHLHIRQQIGDIRTENADLRASYGLATRTASVRNGGYRV
jgi:hypothetical protein